MTQPLNLKNTFWNSL